MLNINSVKIREMETNKNRQNQPQPKTSWLSLLALLGIVGVVGIFGTSRQPVCACGSPARWGKTSVGTLNHAQQAYWIEHQRFAQNIEGLDSGISSENKYYRYSTVASPMKAVSYAIPRSPGYAYVKETYGFGLYSRTVPHRKLPTYVGAVFVLQPDTTTAILCKADEPGIENPTLPKLVAGQIVCAQGTTAVK